MNCRNPRKPRRTWTWLKSALFGAILALGGTDIHSQTIWDGGSLSFTNTAVGGEVDVITAQTSLTRAAVGPLYNLACQAAPGSPGCAYAGPCNTEWAYGSIANWNTLTYGTWINMNGCAPPSMVGQSAVCHLIAENIYFQVTFNTWGGGGSGGFSYTRTTGPLVACDNTLIGGQYPITPTTAGAEGVVTTISTCNYEQEFSVVTGIIAGRDYEFTSSTGGYITVYQGSSNGTILGAGYSPLTVTSGAATDLFPHWNVDDQCATASSCMTTTVELLPLPPCDNTLLGGQYPFGSITPAANGTVTTISTCNYLQEYSVVTGISSGTDYIFDIATVGGYVTVRTGSSSGPVVGVGIAPLTVTAPDANDLFPHWNTNAGCGTESGICRTTTVQLVLVCTQPTATTTIVPDCGNNQFSVDVDVTSLGDATSVTVDDGGLTLPQQTLATGIVTMGPYASGTSVNFTVIHDQDNTCNVALPVVMFNCPVIISSFPYCQYFQGAGGFAQCGTTCGNGCVLPVLSGWTNAITDNIDWTVDAAGTPSLDTGPTGDNPSGPDGGAGFYLYTEASSPCFNSTAIVYSPNFDVSTFAGDARASLAYHMFGQTMGSLTVEVEDPAFSNNWTTLFTISGQQTTIPGAGGWMTTPFMDHTPSGLGDLRYRITGQTGIDFWSDMAIDDFCLTEATCNIPDVTVTVQPACPTPQFNVDVDIITTGDGATVDLEYTVNGGTPTVLAGLGVGLQVLGPFNDGDDVDVTVAHASDASCDQSFPNLTSICPAPGDNCGNALDLSTLTSPYSSSTLASNIFDDFADACAFGNTSPDLVFFIDVPNNYTLEIGQTVNSYDSENTVYYGPTCPGTTLIACWDDPDIQTISWVNTTGSTQTVWWVQDGYSGPTNAGPFTLAWNLIACSPPAATVTLLENCGGGDFSLDVDVTSFGSGAEADLQYTVNGGTPTVQTITVLGITTLGPFPSGSNVLVELLHENDSDCDLTLGTYTDCCSGVCANAITAVVGTNFCPIVNCGGGASNIGGTGGTNARWFTFTPPVAGTLGVNSCGSTVDTRVKIHTGTCGGLTNVAVNDDGCGLQSTISGVAATAGTTYYIEWDDRWFQGAGFNWQLTFSSLTCVAPQASAMSVDDCNAGTFTVDIDITDLGSAPSIDVVANPGGVVAAGVGLGVTTLGPFPQGTIFDLTLVNTADQFCTLGLGSFSDCCSGNCVTALPAILGVNSNPPIDCGGGATNAFAAGATNARWWTYTATQTGFLQVSSCSPLNVNAEDTRVSMHTGTCGSLTFVGGDDDGCATPTLGSLFTTVATPGTTYYIEWDDRWDSGPFDWELSLVPCSPPANDLCLNENPASNPLSPGGSLTYSNMDVSCSSDDVGIVGLFGAGTSGYAWVSFELQACANVQVSYCGTTGAFTNGSLNMYADCGGSNPVNSQSFDFTTCGDGNPTIFYNSLPPGQYYYPVLSGANWANNVFTVNVTATAPSVPCSPNTCDVAEPIACGGIATGTTLSNFATQTDACLPNHTAPGPDAWYVFTNLVPNALVAAGDGVTNTFDLNGSPATVNNVMQTLLGQVNAVGDGTTTTYDLPPGVNANVSQVLVDGVPQTSGGAPVTNWTITVDHPGWGDEISWTLTDANSTVVLSGGPYGNADGPHVHTVTIPVSDLPAVFDFENSGTINDNIADVTVECESTVVYQTLALPPGSTINQPGLTCGAGAADYFLSAGTGPGGIDQLVFNAAPAVGLPVVIDYTSDVTLFDPLDYSVSVGTGPGGVDQLVLVNTPLTGETVTADYGLLGGDQLVTASTCFGTTYNSMLTVYEDQGGCGNLVCITGNDDNCGGTGQSEVNWIASAGGTYYIAVHGPQGFLGSTGDYTLSVTCAPPCTPQPNDVCSGATPLVAVLGDGNGVPSVGDNSCSFADANPSCDISGINAGRAQGVWHTFTTDAVNTQFELTLLDFDEDPSYSATALSYVLYAGADCDNLLEVACNLAGEGTNTLPDLDPNTTYWLMVFNDGGVGIEGTYGILLEYPAQNDASLAQINYPVGTVCTQQIIPAVELVNLGVAPLTSVDITYQIDGGTPVVFNWTGNLAYQASVSVELPMSVVAPGPHTIDAFTSNPNGVADEVPTNDAAAQEVFDATGQEATILISTDNYGSETSWELYDPFLTLFASGGPYPSNQVNLETLCLPVAPFSNCYYFVLFDSFGDGICCTYGPGFWQIRNANNETLLGDIFHGSGTAPDGTPVPDGDQSPAVNTASPVYGDFSGNHVFCLPVAPITQTADIEPTECGIFTNTLQNKVYCDAVAGASDYQFQFLDPDAGFNRNIAVSGRRWVKFSEMQTTPLLPGTHYFVRARADDPSGFPGFFDDVWGTGCETGIDPAVVPGCTQLIDDPSLPTNSCGGTYVFGGSDRVWAYPVVGGTSYRFRFENPGEGFIRNIARPSYICLLNWFTLPLTPAIYDVSVEVQVNGQWGGFCGASCPITIVAAPSNLAGRDLSEQTTTGVSLWPNPVRDGNVNLTIEGLTLDEQRITVDLYDMFGKRVLANSYEVSGEVFNAILEVDGLAAGIYMAHINTGEGTHIERISVQ